MALCLQLLYGKSTPATNDPQSAFKNDCVKRYALEAACVDRSIYNMFTSLIFSRPCGPASSYPADFTRDIGNDQAKIAKFKERFKQTLHSWLSNRTSKVLRDKFRCIDNLYMDPVSFFNAHGSRVYLKERLWTDAFAMCEESTDALANLYDAMIELESPVDSTNLSERLCTVSKQYRLPGLEPLVNEIKDLVLQHFDDGDGDWNRTINTVGETFKPTLGSANNAFAPSQHAVFVDRGYDTISVYEPVMHFDLENLKLWLKFILKLKYGTSTMPLDVGTLRMVTSLPIKYGGSQTGVFGSNVKYWIYENDSGKKTMDLCTRLPQDIQVTNKSLKAYKYWIYKNVTVDGDAIASQGMINLIEPSPHAKSFIQSPSSSDSYPLNITFESDGYVTVSHMFDKRGSDSRLDSFYKNYHLNNCAYWQNKRVSDLERIVPLLDGFGNKNSNISFRTDDIAERMAQTIANVKLTPSKPAKSFDTFDTYRQLAVALDKLGSPHSISETMYIFRDIVENEPRKDKIVRVLDERVRSARAVTVSTFKPLELPELSKVQIEII